MPSLDRNLLKTLQGIEAAAYTLEQLWISYNQVDKLKPLRNLTKLMVLYVAHNYVHEWRKFEHMMEPPELEDLVFIGNPLEEEMSAVGKYYDEVIKLLLYLRKLNGFLVITENEEEATEEVSGTLDLEEINRMAEDSEEEDD